MKKIKKIKYALFTVLVSTLLIFNVNAVDKFEDTITASIIPWDPAVVNLGGGYTASVVKKNYTDGVNSGKIFCTLFKKSAPKGTCKKTKWNDNDDEDKKIAAAVGKMIAETRKQSSNTDGTLDWDTYVYAEMAINNFLYLYNGKKADNNVQAIYGSTKWSKISSNAKYKAIFLAGETTYKSYGKTRVELTNPKITLNEEHNKATVTAKLNCYNANNKLVACSPELTNSITLTGVTTNNQSISQKLTPNYDSSTRVLSASYTLNNDTFKASDASAKNYIRAAFDIKNKTTYETAQQYYCSSTTQPVTPNLLVWVTKKDEAKISARTYYTEGTKITCSLTINKYNQSQDSHPALKGAAFELYSDQGLTEKVDAATTNSRGSATFSDLDPGTYYIKETKAPSGFTINSDYKNGKAVELVVDGNTCAKTENVGNAEATGSISISKVDENNQFVKGAKIKVYTITYQDGSNQNLQVDDDTNSEEVVEDYDSSKYKYNYLKFDASGNYNPNGEFDYFISSGAVNTITGLKLGETYYVQEESVPEDSKYAIKVGQASQTIDEAKNYDVMLVNNESSFFVSKQAIAGSKELPGAKLEIFYENGDSTDWRWESTDKPQEITGLADGNYVLTETTAPKGYEKAESISFTIENGKLKDNSDNTIVMKDKEIAEVPDTFTASNIFTMIVGLLLVVGGSVALAYEYKKRKTA